MFGLRIAFLRHCVALFITQSLSLLRLQNLLYRWDLLSSCILSRMSTGTGTTRLVQSVVCCDIQWGCIEVTRIFLSRSTTLWLSSSICAHSEAPDCTQGLAMELRDMWYPGDFDIISSVVGTPDQHSIIFQEASDIQTIHNSFLYFKKRYSQKVSRRISPTYLALTPSPTRHPAHSPNLTFQTPDPLSQLTTFINHNTHTSLQSGESWRPGIADTYTGFGSSHHKTPEM